MMTRAIFPAMQPMRYNEPGYRVKFATAVASDGPVRCSWQVKTEAPGRRGEAADAGFMLTSDPV